MGRGRAKAKQTKVARELKYSSHETDFDALQRELSGGSEDVGGREDDQRQDDPYEQVDGGPYADEFEVGEARTSGAHSDKR